MLSKLAKRMNAVICQTQVAIVEKWTAMKDAVAAARQRRGTATGAVDMEVAPATRVPRGGGAGSAVAAAASASASAVLASPASADGSLRLFDQCSTLHEDGQVYLFTFLLCSQQEISMTRRKRPC